MLFFDHPSELHNLHCAALQTVASASHQTTESPVDILTTFVYATKATGYALHESKNGLHYCGLSYKFYA